MIEPDPTEKVGLQARASDQLRLLGDVSELLSSTLDQGFAVEKLARLVVPQLADWCIVTVSGAAGATAGSRDLGWAHRDPSLNDVLGAYARRQFDAMSPDAAVSVVLRTGRPVIVREMPASLLEAWVHDPDARQHLAGLQPASVAVLPLTSGGRTLGAIAMVMLAERGPHTPEQLSAAFEVSRRAGMALDNARLYNEQRHLAETLQRSLLTPAPQAADLEISVRYTPAGAVAQVGGDWYDAFHQPDGSLVLAIGDVVGHDSEAAAAMGQIRALLRGIAYTTGCGPAELLSRLDDALTGLELGTTATAMVVRLERTPTAREPRHLSWSNAGHPPGMILHRGEVTPLTHDESDLLLGVDASTSRQEHTTHLAAGAHLLLYTDGLVERRGVDLDDGLQQLQTVLTGCSNLSAEAVCDLVLDRMLAPQAADDVAILVAHRP